MVLVALGDVPCRRWWRRYRGLAALVSMNTPPVKLMVAPVLLESAIPPPVTEPVKASVPPVMLATETVVPVASLIAPS